jgi:chromosome segregation ATPase
VEESIREGPPADTWRETFGQTIDTERRRATQRVDDHRQKLRDLDARITSQLDEAVAALSREQEQARQATAGAQTKTAGLDERQKLLDERQKQLDARQAELDKLQADIANIKGAADPERLKELNRRESELTTARKALDAEQEKFKTQRDALKDLENNIKVKEQTFAAREQQLKRQRQTVARQLRARKTELAAEAAQEEIGRHANELEKVHRESQQQIERLRADFTESRKNELKALTQQLEDMKKKVADAEAAAERAKQECDLEKAASRNSDSTIQSTIVELTKLREENKQLNTRLADAEKKAAEGGSGGGSGGQELEDLKRRFEMAVQDVRELKTKNVELTEQLAKAPQSPKAAAVAGSGGNDWESMKKRLLAEMDSDFDESKEQEKADKLTVENAIKITDDVVAEKDREITELRQMLDTQAKQVGDVAVGAAAVAQMLDTDELVKQEREALKRLQDQLRDQLRQAELETSVERARLAREKSEIDEKLRSFEAEKASLGPAGAAGDVNKTKSRKWLTRLGLGEGEK